MNSTFRWIGIAIRVVLATSSLSGCLVHQMREVDRATGLNTPTGPTAWDSRIVGLTTLAGQQVGFDYPGAQLRGDSLVATIRGVPYAIRTDSVGKVNVSGYDGKRSVIASIGGPLAVVGVPGVVFGILIGMSGGINIQ